MGLAFLPTTIVMGSLSLGFSEKLIMRFGPRTTLIPAAGLAAVAVAIAVLVLRAPRPDVARAPQEGDVEPAYSEAG